jgi:hypothetical protein
VEEEPEYGPCRNRDRAKELEDIFIRSFEAAYRNLDTIYHPVLEKDVPIRADGRQPEIADEYLHVVEILKSERQFDRELFDSLPLDKSTRFHVTGSRRRGLREPIAVIGANWSPIPDFVKHGRSSARAGGAELCSVLDRWIGNRSVFHYIGVHSTVGWKPEVTQYLPRGDHYRVALVEYDDEIGWRLWHDFPPPGASLAEVFDPESREDKIARLERRIKDLRELQIRGGFVVVDELPSFLQVSVDILSEALEVLSRENNGLEIQDVKGRRILKRDRLSRGGGKKSCSSND